MEAQLLAADVLAVIDQLRLESAAIVGWSDGACIALTLAMRAPTRIARVFFFGCNTDPSGAKEVDQANPIIRRCVAWHARDYVQLSATPTEFRAFADAISTMMKTEPNYSARDLASITVPVVVVHAEYDEFIKSEHARYIASTIPGGELIVLPGVSHFAPLQSRSNSAARYVPSWAASFEHEFRPSQMARVGVHVLASPEQD